MSESAALLSQYLPMLLDATMLVAVAGLWFMWWQNAKRQRRVESMLTDSTKQLHEASQHLQQAMELIEKSTHNTKPRQQKISAERTQNISADQEETQITRMLNLQREGKPVELISRAVGLPLNQVKLMLKLHACRTQ